MHSVAGALSVTNRFAQLVDHHSTYYQEVVASGHPNTKGESVAFGQF